MTVGSHAPPPAEPSGKATLVRVSRIMVYLVYAVLVLAVVILLIAFFLRLFAASTDAPFTQWVYRSAARFMQPFRGIFPAIEGGGGSVLDVSLLFAMLMYGLLAIGVHSLIVWLNRKVAEVEWRSASATRSPAGVRSQ